MQSFSGDLTLGKRALGPISILNMGRILVNKKIFLTLLIQLSQKHLINNFLKEKMKTSIIDCSNHHHKPEKKMGMLEF